MLQLKHVKLLFIRFGTNKDGNIAIMTGVVGLMLVLMVGFAIDTNGALSARQDLQHNLDAVSLAVASSGITKPAEQKAFAQEILIANGYAIDPASLSVQMDRNGEVNVSGQTSYKLAFGGVLKKEKMDIKAKSSAIAATGSVSEPTDIVLVLDTTGSMEGTKLTALQSSANKLIDVLSDAGNTQIQIGVVPFSAYVNVGLGQRDASWIEVDDDYSVTRTHVEQIRVADGYCRGNANATLTEYHDGVAVNTTGCDDYVSAEYVDGVTTTSVEDVVWGGCVRPRHNGKNLLHLTDGEYDYRKIIGFMAPIRCNDSPIVPLTSQLETVSASIDGLETDHNTYMPAGLIWGQRVLSPQEPFTGGRPDTKQIMVLMTDGVNSMHRWGGSHNNNDLNDPDDAPLLEITKQDTVTLCQNVKDEDIELYTIAFEVSDFGTRSMLSKCASNTQNFFNASNPKQLEEAFLDIAGSITEGASARLTR